MFLYGHQQGWMGYTGDTLLVAMVIINIASKFWGQLVGGSVVWSVW